MNLYNILTSEDVVKSIEDNIDYLLLLIPEIEDMINFQDNHANCWNHTLTTLKLSENNFETRLCLLLNDIGRPYSYRDDKIDNHALISSEISKKVLNRFGYDRNFINEVCSLIKLHETSITDDIIKKDYELSRKLYKIQYYETLAYYTQKSEKKLVKEKQIK